MISAQCTQMILEMTIDEQLEKIYTLEYAIEPYMGWVYYKICPH